MQKKRLFGILSILLLLASGSAFAGGAKEQATEEWPTKPITLLCGYSAGGSSDLMVRFLAPVLEKYLKVPVVVVNKPGGGGWLAWNELLHNSKPDGYTFSLINTPGVNKGRYDPANPRKETIEDFDLLCNHVTDLCVIAIRNDETRFTDMKSLVEYGKNNKLLTSASGTGIISDDATTAKIIENQHNFKGIEIVQTGGAKESETLFMSKDVDIYVTNVGDARMQHLNGLFKVLCVFNPKRSYLLPEVPTYGELGFETFTNFSARGYAFPKGVDPKIKAKMLDALKKAIMDPQCKDKVDEMGADTDIREGDEYLKFLQEDIDRGLKAYGMTR